VGEDQLQIYILFMKDQIAGYLETDVSDSLEIEITGFGIYPEFAHHGLEPFFLQWTMNHVLGS
jgi:hypothetical protein